MGNSLDDLLDDLDLDAEEELEELEEEDDGLNFLDEDDEPPPAAPKRGKKKASKKKAARKPAPPPEEDEDEEEEEAPPPPVRRKKKTAAAPEPTPEPKKRRGPKPGGKRAVRIDSDPLAALSDELKALTGEATETSKLAHLKAEHRAAKQLATKLSRFADKVAKAAEVQEASVVKLETQIAKYASDDE